MKYILLFSLVFCNAFSQTLKERELIISKSNPVEVLKLKKTLQADYLNDQKEVRNYLLKYPNTPNAANLQKIINGVPIFYQEDSNVLCVQTLRANSMYPSGSLGLSVTGQGMTIGMWDGGRVRETHVEFATGRLTLGDAAATLSTHSTHVLGTMIAA
jgi:serine protease AprX